jgi:hypothetical protein
MKKISIMQALSNEILKDQKLTIGVDLGDRSSAYCVLNERRNYFGTQTGDHTGSHEAGIR